MDTLAALLETPRRLTPTCLPLAPPTAGDVVVEVEWSGISAGTERLLYEGRMPAFPGMGYPLVPGYEAVGRVVDAPAEAAHLRDRRVFVPGARCFGAVRGLFGASASRLVVPAARVAPTPGDLGEDAVLLALAATAHHVLAGGALPELIVGHGVLGRLLARLTVALGGQPTVWEKTAARASDGVGYLVTDVEKDARRDYKVICDASGDVDLLDTLISRLAPGGEVVLAGFYAEPLRFAFPPAFMREARLRIAAEWKPEDMAAVCALVEADRLDLAGLITHRRPAREMAEAYAHAFDDPACLKMTLAWSDAR
jgi:3-hydroxyethyl bacteriochlorophyllide a dehydrogenase